MIIPAILLLILSMSMIYSSSPPTDPNLGPSMAMSQLVFGVIGIIGYYFLRNFDYRSLHSLVKWSYGVVLLLLILTALLGFASHGAVRWIALGPFNLQPSEFAKPVLILALASFWSQREASWRNIALSLVLITPFVGLIFKQPDLGTALTIVFIWMLMLFAANISYKKLLTLVIIGCISGPLGWLTLQSYQKNRILTFLSPTADPLNNGFHAIQSMIAVGSGELLGKGLGEGTQSRLQFLPEFRTDFIFAFITEELGFIGAMIILLFYGCIFFLLFRVLDRVKDRFGELILIGVMAMLLFQITVNIGMNIGIVPITGITLPFLSYGGSSLITIFLSLGFAASVARWGTGKKEIGKFDILDGVEFD